MLTPGGFSLHAAILRMFVTLRCEHCGWTGTFMEGSLELRREP